MNKRIKVTEYMGSSDVYELDQFIKDQCFDADGNHIMPEDGGLPDEQIDQLRSLTIGEAMPLGDEEAGLTAIRLTDTL